jgi:hypothetical protein
MWRLVYIVGDTEFFRRPETKTVENLDDLDDSSDDSPQVKYDGSWSRTFDAALILVDCNGNFKYKLFHEVSTMSKTRPLSEVDVAAVAAGQGPCATAGRDSGGNHRARRHGARCGMAARRDEAPAQAQRRQGEVENMDKLKYQADSTYVTIEAKHADAQRHADRKNVVCLTNHKDALGIDANTGSGHDVPQVCHL